MSNDEDFSHQNSLEIIQTMINRAKDQFSENGHLYLLWGWVIFICSIIHFFLILLQVEQAPMIWFLTWGALIYQIYYLRKQRNKRKVRTYTDDIIGWVWITFVILMFLFGFLFAKAFGDQYYQFSYVGYLALYGMPTFLSGIGLRFRPLVIGGISCWVLSVVASFTHYNYQLLLLALAVLIAWIIPGYILKTRYKRINT